MRTTGGELRTSGTITGYRCPKFGWDAFALDSRHCC